MSKPILDPKFWMDREKEAKQEHHAIFVCDKQKWEAIERKHREILKQHVRQWTTILDVGCAWGRLSNLLPHYWCGGYLGVDLCPTFIERARIKYPEKVFVCGDFRQLDGDEIHTGTRMQWDFDLGICISIRPMVKRELGEASWEGYRIALKGLCKKVLYLEYDENDEGSLE